MREAVSIATRISIDEDTDGDIDDVFLGRSRCGLESPRFGRNVQVFPYICYSS